MPETSADEILTEEHLNDLDERAREGARTRRKQYGSVVDGIVPDAANIAVAKYVEKVEAGEEIKNPRGYVYTVARNAALRLVKEIVHLSKRAKVVQPPEKFDWDEALKGDLSSWEGPEEAAITAEQREVTKLVYRAGRALLEQRDADILSRMEEGLLSPGEMASMFEMTTDGLRRLRYKIEAVIQFAAGTIMHPRLMQGPRNLLVTLLEQRVDEPKAEFQGEVDRALDWLQGHAGDPPVEYPDIARTMLERTWQDVADNPAGGKPAIQAKAGRRLVAAAAAYVNLVEDAQPDNKPDGFTDDYEVVRAVRRGLGMEAADSGNTSTWFAFQ